MPAASVLSKIRTREDLEYLASDLEDLRVNLYKVKDGAVVPELIRSEFEAASDKNQFIENMRQVILSARVMELTVPAYMEEDAINKISSWVKENIGENVVLRFKIDSSLMAGATVSYNGKFKDYSFKDAFAKAVENLSL